MKKIIFLLFLILSLSLSAQTFSYPREFPSLIYKLYSQNQAVYIILDKNEYSGKFIMVGDDYCVFRTTKDDVIIIPFVSIREMYFL